MCFKLGVCASPHCYPNSGLQTDTTSVCVASLFHWVQLSAPHDDMSHSKHSRTACGKHISFMQTVSVLKICLAPNAQWVLGTVRLSFHVSYAHHYITVCVHITSSHSFAVLTSSDHVPGTSSLDTHSGDRGDAVTIHPHEYCTVVSQFTSYHTFSSVLYHSFTNDST